MAEVSTVEGFMVEAPGISLVQLPVRQD
jgi:hypothetical protein